MPGSLVYSFAVTIPAGTPLAAPTTVNTTFAEGVVEQVDLMVPPGSSGLMGFQLWVLGGQVVPTNLGGYFIWDGRTQSLVLSDLPDSGAWQVVGYNTDIYDHTVYVDYQVTPSGLLASIASAQLSEATLADVLAIAGG